MSGSETDIQWFIARDGKQHGPVSDVELKKIVELSHLKPTDLVWRQGFTDWRAAPSVFPEIGAPAAPATSPAPNPQSSTPTTEASAPEAAKPTPAEPNPASLAPIKGSASRHYAQHTAEDAKQDSWRLQGEPKDAKEAPRPDQPRPDQMTTRPLGTPTTARTAGPFSATGPAPGPSPAPLRATTDIRRPSELSAIPRDAAPPPSRGRRLALVAMLILAMAGVGAWLSSEYRDDVFSYMQSDDDPTETGVAAANVMPSAAPATVQTAALEQNAAPSADDVDRKLQSRHMWVSVKQEFPDWYQARVAEIARLSAEKKDQSEISQYLISEFVTLRRQNAKYALAASTTRHKELAAAFLANLNELSKESGDGCYDFISKGEASATIVSRMDDPAKSVELEAQVIAIVGAIVEGKSQPAEHASPVKTDYDVLAGELGRLGWTQADMQLFANPKALAQAPRSRVCSMLKDWFTAHLAIQDPSTQERLLFETLKPVISG
jgi:hypothetical protein